MSKHHHHPQEGPRPGASPAAKTRRHGVFFYVAGFFILIALLCFIVNGAMSFRSPVVPAPVTAAPGK